MRVEVWSDVVCPWCYIGKRRFDTALAPLSKTRDTGLIQVMYRGSAQPGAQASASKFGGPERAREMAYFTGGQNIGDSDVLTLLDETVPVSAPGGMGQDDASDC